MVKLSLGYSGQHAPQLPGLDGQWLSVEGFLGVDESGNRYFFNVGIERTAGFMELGQGMGSKLVVFLLMARVEDRHGNWVAYDYSATSWLAFAAVMGRAISICQCGGPHCSAAANGRTWSYEYNEGSGGWDLHAGPRCAPSSS